MDASKVQEIFNSSAVKELEVDILLTQQRIEKRSISYDTGEEIIKCLLGSRKTLLNHMFVMDEEAKQLLHDFNEVLKTQMIEMRKRAIAVYEANVKSGILSKFSVFGKCFLGYEYSKIHPVQTMRAKKMWAVLNGSLDEDYMPLYQDGVELFGLEHMEGREDCIPSENQMLYLEEKMDNWNDELDQEMTKDMHLIHPFHNLYSHLDFSIFDLLWVRDFNVSINIESDYNTYPDDYSGDDLDWGKCDYCD